MDMSPTARGVVALLVERGESDFDVTVEEDREKAGGLLLLLLLLLLALLLLRQPNTADKIPTPLLEGVVGEWGDGGATATWGDGDGEADADGDGIEAVVLEEVG